MHSIRKVVLIISALFFSTNLVQAQALKSFSEDPKVFFDQLFGFVAESNPILAEELKVEFLACWPMEKTGNDKKDLKKEEGIYKDANKVLLLRFKKLKINNDFLYSTKSKKFTDSQISEIIKICNSMLKGKLKPVPHFNAYVLSLLSFINTNQTDESFNAWNKALNQLLNENTRYFVSFIESCNEIFLYGSIYANPNLKWLKNTNRYYFDYDSLPKVVFNKKFDLVCYAREDSTKIYDTKGVYYPTTNKWYGVGGIVMWDRAGIDSSVSHAILNKYEIEMKSPYFKADSVIYKNTKYVDHPMLGWMEERVLANQTPKTAIFPKFYSYSERIIIPEIVDSVYYEGAFVINGGKFVGKGIGGSPSKLIFKKFNKDFLVVEAPSFIFDDDKFSTTGANVKMYLDSDSIYHPYLQLKFLTDKRELTLIKNDKGIGETPYFNTFHRVDMNIEWMRWEIDKPYLEFSALMGSGTGEIRLESSSFYSAERFRKIQGLEDEHPLYKLKKFVTEKNDKNLVFLDLDYAKYLMLDDEDVKRLLIRLSTQGFLQYDVKTGKAVVQNKVFEYIGAKSQKGDYDNIYIQSIIKDQPNITMNLINYDMTVRGVSGVAISNIRKTGFIPENGQFQLHKNRNMTFSGVLRSGNYEFHGKKFSFNYDNFKIDLEECDSARFMAVNHKIEAVQGQKGVSMVNSIIEDVRGDLQIDYPYNKSGQLQDSFPQYPIFKTNQNSYVRYNKRNLQGNVYDPDLVYFRLDPFEVDSLGYFSNSGVRFSGSFKSGGIFPEFDEDLVLMPNHSLGFVKQTPPEGFPVFDGKGVFKNKIMLSNDGIIGDGDFEYITSTTTSKAMVFFLDSINAMAEKYKVEPQMEPVEYTDVNAENVKIHFSNSKDFMSVKNTKAPINMYNNVAKLDGEMVYSPKRMTGSGVVDFENGELKSKEFEFDNFKFNADTADFKLKGEDKDGVAFATVNVNATINFKERKGDFISNSGSSYVNFPVNQYRCLMDQMTWFMDDAMVEMSTSKKAEKTEDTGADASDLRLSGSEFTSTHPDQDSLRFISPKANYDLRKNIISAHEVQYINVADARIYTSDGEIVIKKNAVMEPLLDAKIIANTTTKYHTITNANVKVLARRNYTAEGDYVYVDAEGGEQKVRFTNIRVDKIFQTVASGEIPEQNKFMLNQFFAFKGTAQIEANKLGMFFKGGTRLQHNCSEFSKSWLNFEAEIDPKNVMIPIGENLKSADDGAVLTAGINLKVEDYSIYGTFLSPRGFHADEQIITANGFLKYNFEEKAYQISNKDKLNENSFPGNLITLDTKSCVISGEGELKMDKDLGQFKMKTFGTARYNPKNDSLQITTLMALDFFIDDAMWKNMQDNILGNPALKNANNNRVALERGILTYAGKELGDKLVSELNLFGQFKKIPDEITSKLLFSEIDLYWDNRRKAYMNLGPYSLMSMDKKQVNKYFDGHVFLQRSKKGEEYNLYIELTPDTWYYFNYTKGVMRCLSSKEDFNNIIVNLKDEKREGKGAKNDGPYTFLLGTEISMKKFLNTVREN